MLEVRMPRLSESMAEGTIVRWLHESGAEVERGDELGEIETDKATVAFEADVSGVLEILAAEGETLPVGAVIARLGDGSAAPAPAPVATSSATSSATPAVPAAVAPPAAPAAANGAAANGAAANGAAANGTANGFAPTPNTGRVAASPLARRRARELGVDLATVQGTGPGGRIVRADIEVAARRAAPAAPAPVTAPTAPLPAPAVTPTPDGGDLRGSVTTVELSRVRQLVARRMAEATTVPVFALTAEIDMTGCIELRARIKELPGDGPVPTFTDLVVAASGRALREFPRVNASFDGGSLRVYGRVNVGVAVDTPDALLVPTVTDADSRSLRSIAATTRELAQRAREGKLRPAELDGGTFTVSNLGMLGVTEFEAVVNPPQAAILAVGAMRSLPRVVDGDVVARPVMAVTLTCDHRVLDGAEGARFLQRLVELLTGPIALLLD